MPLKSGHHPPAWHGGAKDILVLKIKQVPDLQLDFELIHKLECSAHITYEIIRLKLTVDRRCQADIPVLLQAVYGNFKPAKLG